MDAAISQHLLLGDALMQCSPWSSLVCINPHSCGPCCLSWHTHSCSAVQDCIIEQSSCSRAAQSALRSETPGTTVVAAKQDYRSQTLQRGTCSVHLRPLRSMGTGHISCLLLTCKLARNLGTTCGSVRLPVTRGTGHSTLAPPASPLLCNSLTRPCVLACRSTVLLNVLLRRSSSLCRSSQQLSLPYGQSTRMSYG